MAKRFSTRPSWQLMIIATGDYPETGKDFERIEYTGDHLYDQVGRTAHLRKPKLSDLMLLNIAIAQALVHEFPANATHLDLATGRDQLIALNAKLAPVLDHLITPIIVNAGGAP